MLNIIDSNITDYSIKSDQCLAKIEQLQNELNDCKEALKEKDILERKCANLEKERDDLAQQKNQAISKIANMQLKQEDCQKKLADAQIELANVQKEKAAGYRELATRLKRLETAQLSNKQRLDGKSLVYQNQI